MKAKKKPVVIDYFPYTGDINAVEVWLNEFYDSWDKHFIPDYKEKTLKVKTLEGTSYDVPVGYIIIRGVKGEYYPCDPDIFEATYDKID